MWLPNGNEPAMRIFTKITKVAFGLQQESNPVHSSRLNLR